MKVKKRTVRAMLAWVLCIAMMASMLVTVPVFAADTATTVADATVFWASNLTLGGGAHLCVEL